MSGFMSGFINGFLKILFGKVKNGKVKKWEYKMIPKN